MAPPLPTPNCTGRSSHAGRVLSSAQGPRRPPAPAATSTARPPAWWRPQLLLERSPPRGPVGACIPARAASMSCHSFPLQPSTRSPNTCSGLRCPSLPSHLPSPCPKTPPLHNCPEAGTAQPQNKPTSNHPSNRGIACWSYWNGSCSRAVSGRAVPQFGMGSPRGRRHSSQGWGLWSPQYTPPPCPEQAAMGTPPTPFTWVRVQRAVRRAASALWQRLEGAASSMPGVTEPD